MGFALLQGITLAELPLARPLSWGFSPFRCAQNQEATNTEITSPGCAAPSGFFNLLTPCSSRNLPMIFHTGATHRIYPTEVFPPNPLETPSGAPAPHGTSVSNQPGRLPRRSSHQCSDQDPALFPGTRLLRSGSRLSRTHIRASRSVTQAPSTWDGRCSVHPLRDNPSRRLHPEKKHTYRGVSLIRNPFVHPAVVSRKDGADPLLSFQPSRVLSPPAIVVRQPYFLPCTSAHRMPGWPLRLCFGVLLTGELA